MSEIALVAFSDLERMACAIVRSNLFGIRSQDQAIALMLIAQAEGQHPAIIARDYDIIQNRPAKKTEAMLRSFLQSGGKVTWHKLDDSIADATFSHPAGGEVRLSWDMKRAAMAGLANKDNYKKFPRQMLRNRCVSEGVRTVCPMATSGMYVPEEVQDLVPDRSQSDASDTQLVSDNSKSRLVKAIEASKKPSSLVKRKEVFATLKEAGISQDSFKAYLKERFDKESTDELTDPDFDEILEWISASKLEHAKPPVAAAPPDPEADRIASLVDQAQQSGGPVGH